MPKEPGSQLLIERDFNIMMTGDVLYIVDLSATQNLDDFCDVYF